MMNLRLEVVKLAQNGGFSKRILRFFRKDVVEATWCLIFLSNIQVDPFLNLVKMNENKRLQNINR